MTEGSMGRSGESEAALRALESARDEVETLRRGDTDPAEARGLILRAANAVDRSLRRLLRDQEDADLALRLKALAPDELRSEAVLSELRRIERLPVELAAAVHELFVARRKLEAGGEPTDTERARAVRVVDGLTREIKQPSYRPTVAAEASVVDPMGSEPAPRRRTVRGGAIPVWAIAAAAVLVFGAAVVWSLARGGDDPAMDEAIALFRSGAYADAAQHFWRYAEANPDDATPHLYLARIHRRMDRPDLAADAIRQAQEIAPQDPAVHRELGFLLLDTGQPDVAVTRFREAIELDQNSSEGWVGLVRALRESGRESEVSAVIAQAPAEVQALLTRPGAP